jgi:hypothetical protein
MGRRPTIGGPELWMRNAARKGSISVDPISPIALEADSVRDTGFPTTARKPTCSIRARAPRTDAGICGGGQG